MIYYTKRLVYLLLFLSSSLHAYSYRVRIEGVDDKNIISTIKESVQVFNKSNSAVSGWQKLKKVAAEDVDRVTQACRFHGYLSAHTTYSIVQTEEPLVVFKVELGPLYHINHFVIIPDTIDVDIVKTGVAATTSNILETEQQIIDILMNKGYRFAVITNRSVRADLATHTVDHTITIDPGKIVYLQEPAIHSTGSIKLEKIRKCIAWNAGDPYSKAVIAKTQNELELSNLFSQVSIREDDSQADDGIINVEIDLEETPHHTVGAGISYMTIKGPGLTFDVENRNIRQLGEKVIFKAELWKRFQTIATSFQQQDIFNSNETLTWFTEYDRQKLMAFSSHEISVGVTCDKEIAVNTEGFAGLRLENLRSFSEQRLNRFYLVKFPFGIKYNTSNDLLDPTTGNILHTKLTPSYQFRGDDFSYLIHMTTLSTFHSLPSNLLTFAAKITLGNIVGASRNTIPLPDRFYGGSDNTLRGYKYQTLSPLDHKGDPIGGRSILAASLETRFRTASNLGWVLFYDIGNVYKKNLPDLNKKQFSSCGVGARYMTPIGPLRLDIAFPLDRRKNLDSRFQIYFSIGQAF